jgi:hypothetical protein
MTTSFVCVDALPFNSRHLFSDLCIYFGVTTHTVSWDSAVAIPFLKPYVGHGFFLVMWDIGFLGV